jgi:hypothetical protein
MTGLRAKRWEQGLRHATTAFGLGACIVALPQQVAAAPARAAQHPIAAMIGVPFQNNAAFSRGPDGHAQNILDIQPAVAGR